MFQPDELEPKLQAISMRKCSTIGLLYKLYRISKSVAGADNNGTERSIYRSSRIAVDICVFSTLNGVTRDVPDRMHISVT